jgi:diguanylate cyclase (GGDEF)-like protein/PAS domain S-box-containing protein
MSNAPRARAQADAAEFDAARPAESTASVAIGTARANAFESAEDLADLHHHLRAQLREAQLHSAADTPELRTLLRLISAHYEAVDEERRGIVQSMRLMADEARAMAHEVRQQSSEHLQVILDHIKDVVLTVDEDGSIRTFNPTGERVFGYGEAEVVGRRIDLLIPQIAEHETIPEALQRLAATSGDTLTDLAASESWGLRKDGKMFPAEIAISHASLSRREMFVVCLREVTERHDAERVAAAERDVFEKLTANAPLATVLESIARLIESGKVRTACSVSVLADDGCSFSYIVAPRLSQRLREALERVSIDIRSGSCAAAVHLGRQVLVADLASDPFWQERREIALDAGLRAAWSTPIKTASGKILGALGVYRTEAGLPTAREAEMMAHAAQLAGIAIERRLAEEALRSSEAKFRGLFEAIAEGVYQSARDGRLLSVNPAFVSLLGYSSAQEMYALPSVSILYWNPDDRAEFCRRVESEGEIRNNEFCMRRRDGEQLVVLENSRTLRDAAGRIAGYEGTIADITERKRAEQAVFAEKERAQVTLASIGDAVISTDADGCIDYLNAVAESLTGWSVAEARGRPIADVLNLVNEMTREPIENPLLRALGRRDGASPVDHSVLVTRAGQEVAIQESAAPICDRHGEVIGAVTVFHDVTKERRLKRALSYQASHDALTGLINRREFDTRLQSAVLNAQTGAATHALLYVDLDQFKVVNDTCGHQAGDRLLRDVTGLLQTRVRASDTLARLGGDEFGMLLESCTLDQATRIAESVRQSLHEYRFVWGASTLSVGASVGVVEIKSDTENVASVMSAADIACYAAKEGGRNRIHVYEAGGVSNRHREMHWVARITRAVEENRLELFFQPIVAIGSQAAPSFHELTVRLRGDDGELVPPSEFIPAAERYNVMSVIDRWVVLQAVELLRERQRRGVPLPTLAVNLSGTSLNEQSFLDFALQNVGDARIAAALCFEITETAAVTNLTDAIHFMRELQARGCRFALDDFGSGISSFLYLKTLPVDFLKIDGQFISHIADDPVDRSMVEAICKVGKALGIATVAESVETAAVLAQLERLGVDFVQGYYMARPRPLAELGS